MPRCDPPWLTVRAGLEELILQEHHSAYRLFHAYDIDNQYPQMITMIGQGMKTWFMQKVRFRNTTHEATKGGIYLRPDLDTMKDPSPIIIADCELHTASSYLKIGTRTTPADTLRRPLVWHKRASEGLRTADLAYILYAKLIAPFSTVICIFAEDFGGLAIVAQVLALWLTNWSNRPSDLPQAAFPRVLVFTQRENIKTFDEDRYSKKFTTDVRREAERRNGHITRNDGQGRKSTFDDLLDGQFGGMRVVAFPPLDRSNREWKQVKQRIYKESNELHRRRQNAYVAFSARHLKAFFHLAMDHFSQDIVSPFSFIKAARSAYPVPVEYGEHLAYFLAPVDKTQMLNFAARIIAAAFVFDSFPPGMHRFNPAAVFRSLYYKLCLMNDPFSTDSGEPSRGRFVNAIEVAFIEGVNELYRGEIDDISLHRRSLSKFPELWEKRTNSTRTCFSCLARSPEKKLQCGHTLCLPCTMAHGTSDDLEPWTFSINTCPFCEAPNSIKFSEKPDTAGVRMLIAEGGGIRGVIPLAFLKELEAKIDLPMSIQDHVDIAFGSSAGAIVVLGLFCNKWNTEKCLDEFQSFSKLAFQKRPLLRLPFTSSPFIRLCVETVLSFATDSRYGSQGIDKALKCAFGNTTAMFGVTGGSVKLGVVTTTVENSATNVFTNYNGKIDRPQECGYNLRRQDKAGNDLMVWQIARASTAAPPYFKPYKGFQDGGLGGHNNPINLALWEQDIMWSRNNKQPDVVLSLGTGFRKHSCNDEERLQEKTSFLRTRYVPRLFRSFLNLFVGETRWLELQNSLLPQMKERYHRMNIEFNDNEPDLDDVKFIPSLRHFTENQARSSSSLQHCADNFIASLFYVELKGIPVLNQALFACEATIRCRLGPSHKALRVIAHRLKETQARFYLDFCRSIACIDDDLFREVVHGSPYLRPIIFYVTSLEEVIDIKIDGIIERARSISNCPYKIQTIIEDQTLDCVFGHRKGRKRLVTGEESRSKRTKIFP